MTLVPFEPKSRPSSCSCCDEVKTERGVLISIERAEAMIYRFLCGACIAKIAAVYEIPNGPIASEVTR